jgi:hypothetical protein
LPEVIRPLPEGVHYLRIEHSKKIGDPGFNVSFAVGSFYTFNSSADISIDFYSDPDCGISGGDPIRSLPDSQLQSFDAGTCISLPNPIQPVQCIKIRWHKPGVYLFNYPGGRIDEPPPPGGKFKIYQADASYLPPYLSDDVQSIALVDDPTTEAKYGVILHNIDGPRRKEKGWAHLYLPDPNEAITYYNTDNSAASSITVFKVERFAPDADITICRNIDCEPSQECVAAVTFNWDGGWWREECEPGDADITTGENGFHPHPQFDQELVRVLRVTGDGDFDGRWWDDTSIPGGEIEDGVMPGLFVNQTRQDPGITAIRFGANARYLAILYDRRDAVNNQYPGGDALVITASEDHLGQLYFDNATGAIFLIKIKD